MNHPNPQKRSPWPLAISGLFGVFIVFLMTFIVWAVGQKQDLVAENYYEREVRYQEQLDRVNRTQILAGPRAIKFDPATRTIQVTLPSAGAGVAKGRIHFYRPSNARLDQEVPLAVGVAGAQAVDARGLAAGLWKVRVEWSAEGKEYYFDQSVIVN